MSVHIGSQGGPVVQRNQFGRLTTWYTENDRGQRVNFVTQALHRTGLITLRDQDKGRATVTLNYDNAAWRIIGRFCKDLSSIGCPFPFNSNDTSPVFRDLQVDCAARLDYGWIIEQVPTPSPTRVPSPTPAPPDRESYQFDLGLWTGNPDNPYGDDLCFMVVDNEGSTKDSKGSHCQERVYRDTRNDVVTKVQVDYKTTSSTSLRWQTNRCKNALLGDLVNKECKEYVAAGETLSAQPGQKVRCTWHNPYVQSSRRPVPDQCEVLADLIVASAPANAVQTSYTITNSDPQRRVQGVIVTVCDEETGACEEQTQSIELTTGQSTNLDALFETFLGGVFDSSRQYRLTYVLKYRDGTTDEAVTKAVQPGNPVTADVQILETGELTSSAKSEAERCDVNEDGTCNAIDYAQVLRLYGQSDTDIVQDINRDGRINSLDLSIVLKWLGEAVN